MSQRINDIREIDHIVIDVWTKKGVHKSIKTTRFHKANEFWNRLKGGML